MNQRISNIEKAINISPSPQPIAANKNVAKSSQHPSKQQKAPQQQQQHNQQPQKSSSASSSFNTTNNNSSIADSRMSQFEEGLNDMRREMGSLMDFLKKCTQSTDSPANNNHFAQ
jgi:hypothetical protein